MLYLLQIENSYTVKRFITKHENMFYNMRFIVQSLFEVTLLLYKIY